MASEENQLKNIKEEEESFKNILTKIDIDKNETTQLDRISNKNCLYFICEVICENEKCIIKCREQNQTKQTSENVNKLQPLLQFLSKEHSYKSLEFVKIENDVELIPNAFFVFVKIENYTENSIYKINTNSLSGYIFPSIMSDFVDKSILHEIENRLKENEIAKEQIITTDFDTIKEQIIETHKTDTDTEFVETILGPTDMPILSRNGLINPGNNCYLNALIQLLYDIDDFKNIILQKPKRIDENKTIFDEYYNFKMASGLISSISQTSKTEFDKINDDETKTPEQKKIEIDILLSNNEEKEEKEDDEQIKLKSEVLSKIYGELVNSENNKEFNERFNADILLKEINIKKKLLELNEKEKEEDKKSLLLLLLQSFFENISGTKQNLTYEPLILPLLLFGDFDQQETDEAFKKIYEILVFNDDFQFFDTIGAMFNSNKYFIKDENEFNENKNKTSSELEKIVISSKTEKEIIVNLNIGPDLEKNTIPILLEKQSEPQIIRGSVINTENKIKDFEQDYNSKNSNFTNDTFNSFEKDTITDFKKYILFYLKREEYIDQTQTKLNDTPVKIEDFIDIDGKKYKAIGVIVRIGKGRSGHFYYIKLEDQKIYNDAYISQLNETESETMEKQWRIVLYKQNYGINNEVVNDKAVNDKAVNDKAVNDEAVNVGDITVNDEAVNNEVVNNEVVNNEVVNNEAVNDGDIDVNVEDIYVNVGDEFKENPILSEPAIKTQVNLRTNPNLNKNQLLTPLSVVKPQGQSASKENEITPASRTEIKKNPLNILTRKTKGGRKSRSTFRISRKKIKSKK